MSEKNAHTTLRKNAFRPGDRVDRIENVISSGMPDLNGCLVGGNEFWIETKAPTEPKRATTPLFGSNHKLSQDQLNWFMRQVKAGGRCFVYIETDTRRLLVHGSHADKINTATMDELLKVCSWQSVKPTRNKEKWDEFRNAIISNCPF